MALSKRDRIGLIMLVGLFCVFGLLMFLTVDRPSNQARGFEDSVLIQQRMRMMDERNQSQ
jgi:hypothetical protein